jgi:transcriptional regulator GlxA family with amidase domain
MHHIAIVVYPGFELLDATGPASVFNVANRTLCQRGAAPFYKVAVFSAECGVIESSSGVALKTRSIAELQPPEVQTLLVAGAEGEHLIPALADPTLLEAITRLAANADRFGSVCSGGFFLAALGLVDGRRVATHWDAIGPLAKLYPRVSVDPDALYVVDGRLWTSGGVKCGIDMALAMVAHDFNATIAAESAKRLVLYARRPGYQSQFSPVLQAQLKAGSPFSELIEWIQSNLDQPLDIPSLAARARLSERSFHRKFVSATGMTPARFVETVRLDAARMLLSRGLSLKSVAATVGLFPPDRFADAFERRFGVAPRLFRDMHADL